MKRQVYIPKCERCGKVGVLPACDGALCTRCRYGNGGDLPDKPTPAWDAVREMNQPVTMKLLHYQEMVGEFLF